MSGYTNTTSTAPLEKTQFKVFGWELEEKQIESYDQKKVFFRS